MSGLTEKSIKVFSKDKKEPLGDLYGLFFEDLNHAADGGLYAELVQNRSFEFDPIDRSDYHALTAWEKVERGEAEVTISVEDSFPLHENNPNYLTLKTKKVGDGAGILNTGFNSGIPLKKDEFYHFSFFARVDQAEKKTLTISLESKEGVLHASEELSLHSSEWKKYSLTLQCKSDDQSARLILTTNQTGTIYMDMVSLFPAKTFMDRENGLRSDIAQILADLKPKFMRFPGGCLVHDGSLDERARDSMYRWKNTIGDTEKRPSRRNNWKYNQTLGLGYYEYFLFCEDIGAKPIPVLPAGYDPHHHRIVPLENLQPWIDDALDLIEFANGNVSTTWGKIRSELGHPEPFGLEYLGIGNEEVGEPFFERYEYFHRAIKEKHPDIKLINSSGPFAAGGEYDRGWDSAKKNQSDLVDEHYYQSPEWFLAHYHRYDDFKRDEPKVFLGEYASWGNTYYNAIAEAAFMTGLEKNAHAVGLACYAPMLCNVDYINWEPNLIYFNNHQVFGTANYYVQKLFMHHQGDYTLKTESTGLSASEPPSIPTIGGQIKLIGEQSKAEYYKITLTNLETGEVKECPNALVENGIELLLGELHSKHYRLSFKARKLEGTRGFKVMFGEKDNQKLFWEIGGWQNQDSVISSMVNGRGSVLTQSLFTVKNDQEYSLDLEIKGRKITTYIDDEVINETVDKLPNIKPLYYSASIDSLTNEVIIKVVNVKDEAVLTTIDLQDYAKDKLKGTVYELSGYELTDVNSFEAPDKISPKQKDFEASNSFYEYEFPKQSITVFRFQ